MPDFDAMWDFGRPAETESRFRAVLEEHPDAEPGQRLELQTQIARTLGLQRRFDAAQALLDEVEPETGGPERRAVRVRYLLERGRVFNSSGAADRARPLFVEAWELARTTARDELAVDAAHMVAIVSPPDEALAWNNKAMALAESSPVPAARRWRASLANNIGWTHHAAGRFGEALEMFEAALAYRREQGKARDIHTARWCVARCLRSLGRTEEALVIQRELEADPANDSEPGYTFEELGECLAATGRADEARPYFRRAYERLSQDPWLREQEPARLERLRRLGEE